MDSHVHSPTVTIINVILPHLLHSLNTYTHTKYQQKHLRVSDIMTVYPKILQCTFLKKKAFSYIKHGTIKLRKVNNTKKIF